MSSTPINKCSAASVSNGVEATNAATIEALLTCMAPYNVQTPRPWSRPAGPCQSHWMALAGAADALGDAARFGDEEMARVKNVAEPLRYRRLLR